MEKNDLLTKVAYGALAGVAGTLAIQGARMLNKKVAPESMPPLRRDPGDYMARTLLPKMPKPLETASAGLLSYAYGATGSAIYTALRSDPEVFLDGAALGAAIWAAGYLGWLPALGLTPRINRQKPSQVLSSLGQHVLFGVATVGSYRKLRKKPAA